MMLHLSSPRVCGVSVIYIALLQSWMPLFSPQGSLQFDCFPIALNGVLHVTAFTNPLYRSELKQTHHGPGKRLPDVAKIGQQTQAVVNHQLSSLLIVPLYHYPADCSWHKAKDSIGLCQGMY